MTIERLMITPQLVPAMIDLFSVETKLLSEELSARPTMVIYIREKMIIETHILTIETLTKAKKEIEPTVPAMASPMPRRL